MRSLLLESSLLICTLTTLAVSGVAAETGLSGETICAVSLSPTQGLMRTGCSASLSGSAGAYLPDGKSQASNSIKVAVGYCTERCYQQFNYCRYRDEPRDRCVRRLTGCLANC